MRAEFCKMTEVQYGKVVLERRGRLSILEGWGQGVVEGLLGGVRGSGASLN